MSLTYPQATEPKKNAIAGSTNLFFADSDVYKQPGEKKSNDAHAIGAITVDLTSLVESYNTFMKQEGATEEQGFEGFKTAVIEYISPTADKSKETWKETLSSLDDGEFRYALKQGYMPLGYDFSFGEDFANGIGAVVENVELDIERLRQSKDGTALQGVSTWLNDNANGYQHLLTEKDALNNALTQGKTLPQELVPALADDMTIAGMAQETFEEVAQAYFSIKADDNIKDKNEALAEVVDYLSYDRMEDIVNRLEQRGLVPAGGKATPEDVAAQWERAVALRETWPSPQDKNYPLKTSSDYSQDAAQMIFFRGASFLGEAVLTIGENAVKPHWPAFNGTTEETRALSTWTENGASYLDTSEIESPTTIYYQTPDGVKPLEITAEDIEAEQKQIPSEALTLNENYHYPLVTSVSAPVTRKELAQQLDVLMDKTENPAVYTGFGNGGCMDQAAEAVLPKRHLDAVYEAMGKPDEKVNAIDRCLGGMEKARDTTQKLPQGLEAHDHSKNYPFAEQDSQGYGAALQASHQQSRNAPAQQTGISGVIDNAKETIKAHKPMATVIGVAAAAVSAWALYHQLRGKDNAQSAGMGRR